MTHHVQQGRLRSIIMNIGGEAEFRQSTVRPILADSGHYNPKSDSRHDNSICNMELVLQIDSSFYFGKRRNIAH